LSILSMMLTDTAVCVVIESVDTRIAGLSDMPNAMQPMLIETDTEYCLYIHYSDKERAKVIKGYAWDPSRRCWVYPRTKRVLEALISEFGDDLPPLLEKPGKPDVSESLTELSARNKSLTEENNRLESKLRELSQTCDVVGFRLKQLVIDKTNLENQVSEYTHKNVELTEVNARQQAQLDEIANIRQPLAPKIKQLTEEIARRDCLITESRRNLIESQSTCSKLQQEIDSLRASISLPSAHSEFLKLVALESAENDGDFVSLMEQLQIDTNLPIRLATSLERELRAKLEITELGRIDLNGLLQLAKDAETLPRDALDLAHLIRKQRNIIAHSDNIEKSYMARALMCLFASALLWPEFSE
jgi:chromosome segregation ATPase